MNRSFEQEKEKISHRPTQTDTDICPADFAGQKKSSLREKKHNIVQNRRIMNRRMSKEKTSVVRSRSSGIQYSIFAFYCEP